MFERKGTVQRTQDSREAHFEFEVGKPTLDMNDSVTVSDLNSLYRELGSYFKDRDSEVTYIKVKAYASPEGGYDRNRALARERAQHVTGLLKKLNGSGKVQDWAFDSDVAKWSEVQDALEVIGTEDALARAEYIKSVLETTNGIDAQGSKILSMYNQRTDSLMAVALKRVRKVDISYEYATSRVLESWEVFERYENSAEYPNYREGKDLKPYEYYYLLDTLAQEKRWEELEKVARGAYESSMAEERKVTRTIEVLNPNFVQTAGVEAKRKDKYVMKEDAPFNRPYTLAAYYLSCCKLRANEGDTLLLKDYIDANRYYKDKRPSNVKGNGIWNDPAVVVNHVLMYCYAENFDRAEYYALNWLPSDPNDPNAEAYKNLVMFVSCLNGKFEKDPKVREYIKSTSPMNAAVVTMAMGRTNNKCYDEALAMLNDSTKIDQNNANVQYMKAICMFNSDKVNSSDKHADVKYYPSTNIFAGEGDDDEHVWAAPMLEALKLNPELETWLVSDGYFNDAYRLLVRYFWRRMQADLKANKEPDMETIKAEYNALLKKYVQKK